MKIGPDRKTTLAYFIGGPLDLTKRVLEGPVPAFYAIEPGALASWPLLSEDEYRVFKAHYAPRMAGPNGVVVYFYEGLTT